MATRKPIFVGNWKMNGSLSMVPDYFNRLSQLLVGQSGQTDQGLPQGLLSGLDAFICPPFLYINRSTALVSSTAGLSNLKIGGQLFHSTKASGPLTGGISVNMLSDAGCGGVIIGHSEARAVFGYKPSEITSMAFAAIESGLTPIICFGEVSKGEDGIKGVVNEVREVLSSISSSISSLSGQAGQADGGNNNSWASKVVIAYEPVWSIGSGELPSIDYIGGVLTAIRGVLSDQWGGNGFQTRLIYGGSVSSSNAAEIMTASDIDGLIVGGASLIPEEVVKILSSLAAAGR